ncbi:MAG: mechanosensitive ion channel family protein [Peptococcaceae bacterium]|jgi:MscS family membrane protein|nr:mechanosensitive ion channel family protein [Peptococcaceae bacterium]
MVSKLQTWLEGINLEILLDIGIAAAIFIIFIIFRKIFSTYLFKLIVKLTKKAPTEVLTNIMLAFEGPIRALFVIIGIYLAFLYLSLSSISSVLLIRVLRSVLVILVAWGLYNLSSTSSSFFERLARKLNIEVDKIILPFLSKLLRFIIIVMAISIIASEWEYNVGGFVAGLGLGGLAFALAAQESLKNFFGGVVIITEKPFSIGDWIKTPSVEGVVEDITFRSTKIRTFAQALVTVPNSTLANEPITNWTKMGKRQITFNLRIAYDTPRHKIKACVKRIDKMLRNHEGIDQDFILVRFDEFKTDCLEIFLYFFTKTTSWEEYLRVREDVNLKIMEILEIEGVSIAFPSQNIYLEKKTTE